MASRILSLLLALILITPAASAQNRSASLERSADRVEDLVSSARELLSDLRSSDRDDMRRVVRLLETAIEQLEDGDGHDAADYLEEAADVLDDISDDLDDDGYEGRADRVDRLKRRVDSENDRLDDLNRRDRRDRYADDWDERADRWEERAERWADSWEERAEEWAESWEDAFDWEDRNKRRDDWRRRRNRFRSYAPSFVGDFGGRWPYPETSSYRPISSLRYNRVDGLVLGVRRQPLDWDSYDRARVFGQVGYAFGLDEIRYEVGGEARLGHSYRYSDFDLKIGGSYRLQTATDDLWKSSWAENTAAAFFFRTDMFDYYQTEGYTLYAVSRMTPVLQATVAYRSDDYTSLRKNATWALFGGDGFRLNPGVDQGRMQSVVVALDGGKVRGLRWIPTGVAFRAEAEFGQNMGGIFDFNRYIGDIRYYFRTGRDMGLSIRFRGGYLEGDAVPVQKTFTLGGAGSVRAYPQNVFRGSRMLLGNAELTFYDASLFDDILSDIALFGLFDAGWVNGPGRQAFDIEDVIPAAGFGVAFSERQFRLELAWPVRDMGTGLEPTLWLRLNPTF